MKKTGSRALSVLLIAAMIIFGMISFTLRYIDNGRDWALYFARANSGSTGVLTDRNGTLLAAFDSVTNAYSDDQLTRLACYHVTGDYWGRTGTGALTTYWDDMHSFSLLTGTTKAESVSLKLNIDAELNKAAYQAMGDRKGAILMMNYRTGELLCMVSTPVVDPLDAEAEPPDGAYINRCLSAAFTPGSVFKLVTAAAAIENISDIYDRSFYCEGVYDIAGVKLKCSGVHYTQNFEQALSNSCNCAFAQIAVMLGQDTMIEYVQKYGFLDGHSLDGIPTAAGSYPLDFVGDPELAWSGIGQSTDLVCPYSMLRLVAAIGNGGRLIEPKLLSDGKEAKSVDFMKADTAEKLGSMMSYNVASHYGGESNFPGLRLCAKTGTAELGDGTSHAWFAGFLDDEAHPYAFVVMAERGGGGLSTAGKIANTLLQFAVAR